MFFCFLLVFLGGGALVGDPKHTDLRKGGVWLLHKVWVCSQIENQFTVLKTVGTWGQEIFWPSPFFQNPLCFYVVF